MGSTTTSTPSRAQVVDATAPDDAIGAELVLRSEIELGEGKPIPAPKFKPCDKETTKSHVAALQKALDEQQNERCREIDRFNASVVPATYLTCEITSVQGTRLMGETPTITRLLSVEGDDVTVTELASVHASTVTSGSPAHFELWNTPRGYFLDLAGLGTPVFILRRRREASTPMSEGAQLPAMVECLGKQWTAPGKVLDASLPSFPTRGRDVDGDGRPEFPDAIFSHHLESWYFTSPLAMETACNLPDDDRVTVDAVGIEGATTTLAYEKHRLDAARARARRIRAWAKMPTMHFPSVGPVDEMPTPRTRKLGTLRLTNGCALDVVQAAVELFVHARTLGTSAEDAIDDSDELMRGFALRLGECEGGLRSEGQADPKLDHWPKICAELLAWTPQKIDAPAPEAEAAPSAAPSTSASAP